MTRQIFIDFDSGKSVGRCEKGIITWTSPGRPHLSPEGPDMRRWIGMWIVLGRLLTLNQFLVFVDSKTSGKLHPPATRACDCMHIGSRS